MKLADAFPVYVAAPYPRARDVLSVHEELLRVGCHPTSHWARLAQTTVDELLGPGKDSPRIQSAIELNDVCIQKSAAMLVLAFDGEGGEMFCEVERARALYMPIMWVGSRLILSSFRAGTYLCAGMSEALSALSVASEHVQRAGSIGVARMRLHRYFRARAEMMRAS